jgi:hypothetical protein
LLRLLIQEMMGFGFSASAANPARKPELEGAEQKTPASAS